VYGNLEITSRFRLPRRRACFEELMGAVHVTGRVSGKVIFLPDGNMVFSFAADSREAARVQNSRDAHAPRAGASHRLPNQDLANHTRRQLCPHPSVSTSRPPRSGSPTDEFSKERGAHRHPADLFQLEKTPAGKQDWAVGGMKRPRRTRPGRASRDGDRSLQRYGQGRHFSVWLIWEMITAPQRPMRRVGFSIGACVPRQPCAP